MALVIDHSQMSRLQADWFGRMEAELIAALRLRFSDAREPGAGMFYAVAADDLARYVHHIVELGGSAVGRLPSIPA